MDGAKKTALIIGILLFSVASLALGQNEISIADLMKLPGTVIAKGSNTQPVGISRLLTYRVEQLSLPEPITVELQGQAVQVDKAWRVTVTGGPFPVRALPPVIWIGETVVGIGVENERLSEVTVITFDRSLLRPGSAVAVSYGPDKETRQELPEKLNLSGAP
jgi:hypothetical protein